MELQNKNMKFSHLKKTDRILSKLIREEIKRQRETIDLIASENIVPLEILEVLGSPLTNKYSEGYPGRRYYPGNKYYDQIERLAQKRALQAFHLNPQKWAVNVQPYSGSPANLEVYAALLHPGDTLMGMKLSSGGHLTHGHKASLSGQLYHSIQYGVDAKTGRIDFSQVEKLARKYKPKIIISGASAYPRKISFRHFHQLAKKINAYHLADISHIAGLVAAGLHPSPFPYSDVVVTTLQKTLRGPRAAVIFCRKDLEKQINKAVFPGMQGGPHNNVVAAIALTFKEVQQNRFKKYQKQIIKNASVLAQELKKLGFQLVSGGTDNHLMLVDLKNINLSGIEAERCLENEGIIANRNSVPGDTSPFHPNGIRLGTPAVTSRGMKEKEMILIAHLIYRGLIKREKSVIIKREVKKLCKKFSSSALAERE